MANELEAMEKEVIRELAEKRLAEKKRTEELAALELKEKRAAEAHERQVAEESARLEAEYQARKAKEAEAIRLAIAGETPAQLAAEERERREYSEKMSRLASLLPPPEEMPMCPHGCGTMEFESLPPAVFAHRHWFSREVIPTVILICPVCHSRVRSRFEHPSFPMSFDEPMPADF